MQKKRKMKKYILFILLLSSTYVVGQTAVNSLNVSDTRLGGTARYMSLAGSMGAVGGDASAIIDNPAALAIYRSSELAFTLDYNSSTSNSKSSFSYSETRNRLRFNHFSYLIALSTFQDEGLLSVNIGFTYSKIRDFNRQGRIRTDNQTNSLTDYMARISSGFSSSVVESSNISVPTFTVFGKESGLLQQNENSTEWYSMLTENEKINQKTLFEEKGSVGDYSFSIGFNYNHTLYWGLNLDINTIDYHRETQYYESFELGGGLLLHNYYDIIGSGFKLSGGIIYRPQNWLRLGASISTPTYYSLTDESRRGITGFQVPFEYNADGSVKSYKEQTHSSVKMNLIEYTLRSPFKAQASVGFIMGKRGFINIDYQFMDFKYTPEINDINEENSIFSEPVYAPENDELRQYGKAVHRVKVGGELRFAKHYSLRAGYAFQTPIMNDFAVQNFISNTSNTNVGYFKDKGTQYYSLGFGYRYNQFGVDFAYQLQSNEQSYTPYDVNAQLYDNDSRFGVPNSQEDNSLANINTKQSHFVVTFSYKM